VTAKSSSRSQPKIIQSKYFNDPWVINIFQNGGGELLFVNVYNVDTDKEYDIDI
jgi:hypothetical protein